MKFEMEKLGDMARVRFYLALLFFIWSITPHFHLMVHSHAGGEASHVHLSLSSADVAMANRALEALGPTTLNGGKDDEIPSQEASAASVPAGSELANSGAVLSAFDAALKAIPVNDFKHSHYWEDLNLVGMASLILQGLLAIILILYFLRCHLAPISELRGLTLARGPPRHSLV